MNRRTILAAAPAILAGLGLTACTRPVYNVPRRGFDTAGTFDQRTEQIRRAAVGLGWSVDEQAPGRIRATLNLRSHVAVVGIAYDAQGFSIGYMDSRNLGFDGHSIHKNYNGWIENLERAISQQPLP